MGLNLSGIGHLLRRGIDDVGSAITGQPAQSVPQAAQQPMVHAGPPIPVHLPQIGTAPQQLPQPQGSIVFTANPLPATPTSFSPLAQRRIMLRNPSQGAYQIANGPVMPNMNNMPHFNPVTAGVTSFAHAVPQVAKGTYNTGKSIGDAFTNTAQLPLDLTRVGAANVTGNHQALTNAHKALTSDEKNNIAWNDAYRQTSNELAGAVSENPRIMHTFGAQTGLERNHAANVAAANTIAQAYGNTPQAKRYASLYTSANDLNDQSRALGDVGLTPTTSKTATAIRLGAPIASAGLQTMLQAEGIGAGSNAIKEAAAKKLAGMTAQQASKQAVKQTLLTANKYGLANAGLNTLAPLSAGDKNPADYLKAAASGYAGGASMPLLGGAAGELAGTKAGREITNALTAKAADIKNIPKNLPNPVAALRGVANTPQAIAHEYLYHQDPYYSTYHDQLTQLQQAYDRNAERGMKPGHSTQVNLKKSIDQLGAKTADMRQAVLQNTKANISSKLGLKPLDSAGSASGDSPLMPFNKPIANSAEKLRGKKTPLEPQAATPVSKKIVSSEGSIAPELQGKPLLRGINENEWKDLQNGGVSGKNGKSAFVTTDKNTAAMSVDDHVRHGKNAYTVEYKPSAASKVHSGGSIGKNTGGANLDGEYQAKGLGLNDVARVIDHNGKVVYDSTGTAPSTKPKPEALAEAGLTPLPKEIRISAKQDQGSSPTKLAASPEGTPIRLQGQPKGKQLQLTQRKLTEDNPKPSSANNTPELKDEVQQYADTFGITKQQALEDLKQMQMDKVNPKPIPEGMTAPPTIEERRQIIRDNPKQQETQNKIDLGAEDGNYKGAIAKAIFHSEERDKFVKQAALKVNKLSENDKQLFYHWEDGANIDDLLEHATNSKQLQEAIEADKNAMDYHLALDRAAGGSTLRQTNYGLPKYFKLSEKEMDAAGIPENMRFKKGNYTGFHDTSSKYHSYLDAYRKAGLEPLYDNPAEAIMQYKDSGSKVLRDQALYTALAKTVPDHVGPLDMVRDSNGRKFTQGAGRLPFAASNELQPHLKAFRDSWKSNNKVIDKTLDTALFINSKQKAALFFGAPFHYFNGFSRFVGLVGGSGHGIKLVRGTGESFGASLIPGVSKSIMAKAERDGVLQYIKENGGIIHDSSRPQHVGGGVVVKLKDAAGTISPFRLTSQNMSAFFNTMMINLGRALKEKGIESGSFEAQQAMAEYNRILGHFNDKVEGGDPTIAKLLSGGELAPHWIRTQFGLIKDAGQMTLQPGHITGKHGFGMYNAGDIARTTLIGTRLAEGAFATIVTAIALGQAPTLKSLVDRFGANPANPVPNVDLGEKDKKGRHQVIDLPTDPTGLAVGLVTDPQHFTQSRFSPGLSTAQRFITNKDWNGNPLTDPNDPNQLRDRAIGAAKGTLPIGLQNFTNPNITAKQGAMQEVGGRVKTDPNDPQVQSQKQYYANQQKYTDAIKSGDFSAIDPALKNVDPKLAADMAAKWKAYQDLNPGKDPAGNEYSRAWNALSSEQKASFLLMNDQKTGAQVLSPIFYIQKQEALADPNRPHTPLYDLKGNDGVGFTLDANKNVVGTSAQSRAQTALNYQNEADPAMKALEYAANPWLKDYEKNLGNYSANYIPIMTDYMQKQGWTQPAIDDYWKKHAQDAPPISSPTIDTHTQKLMDDYGNITDPTQKAQFFQDNSAELSKAFTALAMYHNQKAVAEGHLPEQTYPTPNANAALGLTQLQKNPNHDKAIGKANALLIQSNPDLAQYLADSGLYNLAKDAARYQFQDPAHPGMNAGQLLNLDRPIDQSTMGAIQNVGKYDIGKDANGKFSFLGAGGTGKFSDGTASGSGGGYSKKSKHIKIVKRRAIKERAYKPTRLHHQTSRTVKTPYSNLKFKHKTKISIAKANKPGNVKIA